MPGTIITSLFDIFSSFDCSNPPALVSFQIISKDSSAMNGHASGEGSFDDDDSTMNVKPMQPLLQGYHRTSRALGIPQNIQNKQQGYQSHNTKYSAYPNKLELKRSSADGDFDSCDINSGKNPLFNPEGIS